MTYRWKCPLCGKGKTYVSGNAQARLDSVAGVVAHWDRHVALGEYANTEGEAGLSGISLEQKFSGMWDEVDWFDYRLRYHWRCGACCGNGWSYSGDNAKKKATAAARRHWQKYHVAGGEDDDAEAAAGCGPRVWRSRYNRDDDPVEWFEPSRGTSRSSC